MAELKPCPFCGKPVTIYYSSATKDYYVVHLDEQKSNCMLLMPLSINHNRLLFSLSDAYNAWNRRAALGWEVTTMDKEAITIQWMDRIIEAIDTFRRSEVPDDVIVKRIYHLCKFERQQAQNNIDAALDALEERMKADGTI